MPKTPKRPRGALRQSPPWSPHRPVIEIVTIVAYREPSHLPAHCGRRSSAHHRSRE
jgi:hypothetical protein